MGRKRLSDETIERIKATYAMTGNAVQTAREIGVSEGTVRNYTSASDRDQYELLREQKHAEIIPTIIEQCADVQRKLLAAMADPTKIAEARFNELAVAFGIVTEKQLLMTGQATSRSETVTDPRSVLTREEMEQAARIRAKLAAST